MTKRGVVAFRSGFAVEDSVPAFDGLLVEQFEIIGLVLHLVHGEVGQGIHPFKGGLAAFVLTCALDQRRFELRRDDFAQACRLRLLEEP